MATVWLHRRDCEEGTLPRVCMRCGRPATGLVEKDLAGTLVWANPIGFFLGQERSSVRVLAPTCDAHRHHWRNRRWAMLGAAAVAVVAGGGVVALGLSPGLSGTPGMGEQWLLLALGYFLLIVLLGGLLATGIQATVIREWGVRLFGVSREFARLYEIESGLRGVDLDALLARRPREGTARDDRKVTNEPSRSQRFEAGPDAER